MVLVPMQEIQKMWVWSLGQENPLNRKWQPTPVFLPGKSMDRGAYSPWGRKETRLKQLHVHTHMAEGTHPFIFAFSRHLKNEKKKVYQLKY